MGQYSHCVYSNTLVLNKKKVCVQDSSSKFQNLLDNSDVSKL